MSMDYADRTGSGTGGGSDRGQSIHSRSSDGSTATIGWPTDVDLDVWYQAERAEVDDVVKDALDLSVWSLESKGENTSIYLHCKNNEKLSYSVRAVARVTGTVANVMECIRSNDSASFRQFTKLCHSRVFLDSEVLHAHNKPATSQGDTESLALKWLAFSNGKKTLGKGKEFCVREYCTVLRNHRQFGTVGVCKFESYDGIGARYAIRAKPDTFSLTVFEPSSFVVCQTPDEGILTVTMTFSMRKARGTNSVSSGVKALSMRLANDLNNLQKTVQHMLFQPASLASKREWIADNERSNCSLCVQTFNMLTRRKHHCRVCGEVVCANCTVFKVVSDQDTAGAKLRVCKACLGKSSTSEAPQQPNAVPSAASLPPAPAMAAASSNSNSIGRGNNQMASHPYPSMPQFKNITLSVVSTSSGASTSSDESRRSETEVDPMGALPTMPPPLYKQQSSGTPYSTSLTSMYSKGSSSSFSDLDINPASAPVSGFLSPRNSNAPNSSYPSPQTRTLQHVPSSRSNKSSGNSSNNGSSSSSSANDKRTHYFNEDFREICMLAMQTLNCAMAGVRTDDFELVNYFNWKTNTDLPRSLPTFRRIASRGKPCIVLDVSADKRIAGEKRSSAKLQFFVGIPLIMDGEVIGDLCVADRFPRESIDYKAVEVLMVLGKTVTQYMTSRDYIDDLAHFKTQLRKTREADDGYPPTAAMKEMSF